MWARILWHSLSCQIFYSILETLNMSTYYFSSKFPTAMATAEHNQTAPMPCSTGFSPWKFNATPICQICDSQSSTGTDFLLSTSIFTCQYHSVMDSLIHSFITNTTWSQQLTTLFNNILERKELPCWYSLISKCVCVSVPAITNQETDTCLKFSQQFKMIMECAMPNIYQSWPTGKGNNNWQ